MVLRRETERIEESVRGYRAWVQSTERRIAMFGKELKDKINS